MKKVFIGVNIILLWITIWHFYRFPITENMSLSLHNKKIYRRLIFNTIDSLVKDRNDLLFNINFGGEEQDDVGRAYVKGLMKKGDVWIGYVYSFDEIIKSPSYSKSCTACCPYSSGSCHSSNSFTLFFHYASCA